MSRYNINKNLQLVQQIIDQEKKDLQNYYMENPDSVMVKFEKDLHAKGFDFEVPSQVRGFLPKHKDAILPLAMMYYEKSTLEKDKRYFLSLFHYKNFEEVVPLMLTEMYVENNSIHLKASISETLRAIHSYKYINDYIKILGMKELGDARNAIITLIGDFKEERAIPLLISALDEGKNITTNALCALGKYKKKELAIYFDKYRYHKNKYYRREANKALEKLSK